MTSLKHDTKLNMNKIGYMNWINASFSFRSFVHFGVNLRVLALPLAIGALTACSTAFNGGPPTATERTGEACLTRHVRTFTALERQAAALAVIANPTAAQRCELALLEYTRGNLDQAESILKDVLTREPRDVGANVLLARVYQRSGRRELAQNETNRIALLAPAHLEVQLLRLSLLAPADASGSYPALARQYPRSPELLARAGAEHLRLNQEQLARELVDRALALDSTNADAHVLNARLYERAKDTERQRRSLDRAIAEDSLSMDAHQEYSAFLRSSGERERAFTHTQTLIRLDPFNAALHGSLAQGGSYMSWSKYPPLDDDQIAPELKQLLDAADLLLLARKFSEAEKAYNAILTANPNLAAARFGVGTVQYHRGQYDDAARIFRDIAHDYPGFGLAHYGYTQTLKRQRDDANAELQAAVARFRAIPTPPEPARLREVFVDYDRLDDDYKKIVLISIAPLSNYIPVLAIAGATFQLLPFHKRLWELPNKENNRNRRTFDLRLWDDVKGQGGFHAVAGEEWMRDVMYERFNVLAHEFMHQVHQFLTQEQRNHVDSLYRVAKREKRTLDSYADYNNAEYLGQAYEAFIAPRKERGLGGTAGHTLKEVQERDPAIVKFLETVNSQVAYRENEIIAYRQKIRDLSGDNLLDRAMAVADSALRAYGDHPELLSAKSGVARLQGNYGLAKDVDDRAVRSFPRNNRGYFDLAEDFASGAHAHKAAADIVGRYLASDSASHDAWIVLAEHLTSAGLNTDARRALQRADSLIGKPNPEAGYYAALARVSLALGNRQAARDAHQWSIQNISRSNITGLMDQAVMALEDRDLKQARALLANAQSIQAESPRVREVEALILAAEGKKEQAVERLAVLLNENPRRIETLTALVSVLGANDPRTPQHIAAGRALIAKKEPVSNVYNGTRFESRGHLNAVNIAAFEKAAGASDR